MPIYEYRCATRGGRVEVLIRSRTTTPICPTCGSPLADKLFSTPHVLSSESRRQPGHTCWPGRAMRHASLLQRGHLPP
jgi:putative FmdB family regulatory protein